jgi:hypothetical protein
MPQVMPAALPPPRLDMAREFFLYRQTVLSYRPVEGAEITLAWGWVAVVAGPLDALELRPLAGLVRARIVALIRGSDGVVEEVELGMEDWVGLIFDGEGRATPAPNLAGFRGYERADIRPMHLHAGER